MDTLGAGTWRPLDFRTARRIPTQVLDWLRDKDSLTQRLIARCAEGFRVEVLGQDWQRPRPDECRPLELPARQWALVRHVRLYCGAAAWVFARTVIPAATLAGERRRLAYLGAKPLGAFLFAQRGLRRGPVEVIALPSSDPRLGIAQARGGARGEVQVWGRRSVFWLAGAPLLVSEFFLPAMALTDEKIPHAR